MNITPQQLKAILKNCKGPDVWAPILNDVLPDYSINTSIRIAQFIAQTGHESAHYNTLKENLNYSAEALRKVFKKYFPNDEFAQQYHRQPEKIANRVYSNRMGNGNEASGDGWLYRGRGVIQITGKNNYRMCSMYLFGDERLLQDPGMLQEPEYAIRSACWYWLANDINKVAEDTRTVTRIINGGYHGINDREQLYATALKVLSS